MMFIIALFVSFFVFYTLNQFSDEPVKVKDLAFCKKNSRKKTVGDLLSDDKAKKNPLLCRLNFHFFEYDFIPFSDQPSYGEDNCVLEGKHVEHCKHCFIEKKIASKNQKRSVS